jgi:hypothetical protein
MFRRKRSSAALLLLLTFSITICFAETIYPPRDRTENGDPISWFGSRTVFVGPYQWPDREPIGLYNEGTPLITTGAPKPFMGMRLIPRGDFAIAGCDLATGTCTTDSPLPAGGLPEGAEVKLITTGKLPGGLVSWQQDHAKVYYIRTWTGRNFRLSEIPGGAPVQLDRRIGGEGKQGLSFAGYMHAMTFVAVKAIRVTCDPASDVCTSTQPHQLLDDAPVYFSSTGKLPDGLIVIDGGEYMPYCAVYQSPTTFKLRQPPSSQAGCSSKFPLVDLKSAGQGTLYLYAIYIPGRSAPGAVNTSIAVQSIKGYPRGTAFTWRLEQTALWPAAASNGLGETEGSTHMVTMYAKVPAVTPAGDFRITVQTAEDRARNLSPNSFQYTLKAVTLPRTPTAGPASYPPIPGLKRWETMMTSNTNGGGSDVTMYPRCANRKYPDAPLGWANKDGVVTLKDTGVPYPVAYSMGGNARVWFYNDESFFKIAKYSGDPTWANCGIYIAKEMRDLFLIKGPNQVLPFFYFPWTMVAAYHWTHDPSYKEAVIRIADEGNGYAGWLPDGGMREHAFAFERRLARLDVTGEPDYHLPYFAEVTLAQLYINATGSPERAFNEPFMLGLAMRPLIRWYMMSHDERIPYVIKLTLDRVWNDWYDKRAHHYFYNPEPPGPRCNNDCAKYTASALNNLVAPAFAWYWRLTGDDSYRQRGDDLFANVWADGPPYNAKEWSQGYYWSWDFVEWREGKKAAY